MGDQGQIQGGQLEGIEAKIGRKGANFARFWPILKEGGAPTPQLLDLPMVTTKIPVTE